MNEQLTPNYEHTPGTRFDDGDTLEIHAANPNLMTFEELQILRRRQEFERQALSGKTEVVAELPPTPHQWVGQVSATLRSWRKSDLELDTNPTSPDFKAWEKEMLNNSDSELQEV
jgi:hypothetical protein